MLINIRAFDVRSRLIHQMTLIVRSYTDNWPTYDSNLFKDADIINNQITDNLLFYETFKITLDK